MLSHKRATAVKLQAFCNPGGGERNNNLQTCNKENNTKNVKQALKCLGASKTGKAMVPTSLSAPYVASTVRDLQSSLGIKPQAQTYHYHRKDDTTDKRSTLNVFRAVRPFRVVNNRTIGQPNSSCSVIHKVGRRILVIDQLLCMSAYAIIYVKVTLQ